MECHSRVPAGGSLSESFQQCLSDCLEDDVPEDPTDFLDLVSLVERTVLPVSTSYAEPFAVSRSFQTVGLRCDGKASISCSTRLSSRSSWISLWVVGMTL